ncbi:MAG: DUF433 domain-containing protein [Rivularia sp. T60_A2020_040]|nr:DUF433 domain-containing protein [Rivularia sp. T60_A2020_040]
MTVKELEAQLLSLTAAEKIEAIRILTQHINQNPRGIIKTPGVMGGDACIAGTRIPVWLLLNYRCQGASDAEILEAYPQLNATDLVNVWVYAQAFTDEIQTAIKQQEEADDLTGKLVRVNRISN